MEQATEQLRTYFEEIRFSEKQTTSPVGNIPNPNPFLNQIAIGYTTRRIDEIQSILKQIEYDMGRRPADKASGNIPIDIDLLQWDSTVLKPEDLKRDYIISGIQALSESVS